MENYFKNFKKIIFLDFTIILMPNLKGKVRSGRYESVSFQNLKIFSKILKFLKNQRFNWEIQRNLEKFLKIEKNLEKSRGLKPK